MNKSKIIMPTGYNIPDGGDINIFCRYSDDLAQSIFDEMIVNFFKDNNMDVSVNIDNDGNYKFVSISDNSTDSVIAVEFWEKFDDAYRDELIECYNDDNLISKDVIINILYNCNSEMMFDCRSREEVLMSLIFASYLSKYTDYIMITDNYSGINLKPVNNGFVILS